MNSSLGPSWLNNWLQEILRVKLSIHTVFCGLGWKEILNGYWPLDFQGIDL